MGFGDWINSITGVINQTIAPTGGKINPIGQGKTNEDLRDFTEGVSEVVSGSKQPTTIIPNPENPLENVVVDNSTEGTIADTIMNDSVLKPLTKEGEIVKAEEIESKEKEPNGNVDFDFQGLIQDARKYSEEQQQKLWEREDKIRAETQAREDSAYSRAIADMRKAGINPNLINISPAQSGGGITQASKSQETTASEVNGAYSMIMNAINNDKDIQENTKDRLNTLVTTALHAYLMFRFIK